MKYLQAQFNFQHSRQRDSAYVSGDIDVQPVMTLSQRILALLTVSPRRASNEKTVAAESQKSGDMQKVQRLLDDRPGVLPSRKSSSQWARNGIVTLVSFVQFIANS